MNRINYKTENVLTNQSHLFPKYCRRHSVTPHWKYTSRDETTLQWILCYFDPWMLMTWILMKSSMRSSQWFTILTVNQQWIPTYSMLTIESAVTVPYCKMPIGCFLNGSIMYILQSSCRNFLSLSNQKLYRIMQVFLKQFIGIVVDQFLMLYNINIAPPTPLNNVAQ